MPISELPVRPTINPLTAEDRDALMAMQIRTHELRDLIAKAQAAGFDLTQQAERNNVHQQVADSLLKSFFPTSHTPPEETDMAGLTPRERDRETYLRHHPAQP